MFFVIALCWWPWANDGGAPAVVGPSDGVVTVVGCLSLLVWFFFFFFWSFVFTEVCALRSFRKVEFVAATFVRPGSKRLPC